MKCQAVRPALSFLVDGQLPLTEWAIIQAHLRECSECREELDRLQGRAAARARVRRRGATVATVVAVAVILAVAGGGLYLYQGGFPDLRRSDPFRLSPWGPAPPPAQTATPAPPA
ncbi:MAG: anti-sigma factor family protein, partial [Candidatus Rokuibacteriota bacterium]